MGTIVYTRHLTHKLEGMNSNKLRGRKRETEGDRGRQRETETQIEY